MAWHRCVMADDVTFPPPPVPCPRCGRETGVMILRGFPTPEAERAARAGLIEHRGCLVGPNDNDWVCRACGAEWRTD